MRPHLNHFTRPPRPPAVGDIAQQLRELPAEVTPPYDFAEFQRRGRERSTSKRQVISWPHAAAAAGLTAVVAAMALLGTRAGTGSNDETGGPSVSAVASDAIGDVVAAATNSSSPVRIGIDTGATALTSANTPSGSVPVAAAAAGVDDDAFDQARAAREWLARQPAEPALVRAGSRLTVAGLEDRIAWFDDALTDQRLHGADPAQLKVLQQERARLVSSLAQVRFAEALVANGS